VLNGRRNDLAKVHRSMQISWILPQSPPDFESDLSEDLPEGIVELGE